jgi:hypothetical protein
MYRKIAILTCTGDSDVSLERVRTVSRQLIEEDTFDFIWVAATEEEFGVNPIKVCDAFMSWFREKQGKEEGLADTVWVSGFDTQKEDLAKRMSPVAYGTVDDFLEQIEDSTSGVYRFFFGPVEIRSANVIYGNPGTLFFEDGRLLKNAEQTKDALKDYVGDIRCVVCIAHE